VYPVIVAFTTLLAEINTIVLPSVFWEVAFEGYLTLSISGFMLIVWCWVFWRSRKRALPTSAETIAGILTYLCESRLPHYLQHLRNSNDDERREAIRSLGRDYDITVKPDSNGGTKWTIDFRD
jgi:hypothetical protein